MGKKELHIYIERMLLKSNNKYILQNPIEELEDRGAIVNGFTTKEYFCIHAKSLKEEVGGVLDLLYEMVFSPSLEEKEIEREKKVIFNISV